MGTSVIAILVAALIGWSAYGYGLPVLRRLGTLPAGRLERSILAVLMGAGMLTFGVLGIGLLGGLTAIVAWLIVGTGVLLTLPAIRRTGWSSLQLQPRALHRPGDLLAWACWTFLLLSGSLNLLAALAPISGTDVLAYHLAVPKLWVEEGRIRYVPGVYYSTAAFGLEMLFTLALLLGSPIAAQVTHFSFGLMAACLVYLLAVRAYGPRVGLLAATLFYAITDVSVQSSIALVDLGAAAYLLAGILAALRWREQGGRWYLVAALLAGFHAGTKMPNLAAAETLWLAMAIDAVLRRELKATWRQICIAGTVVAVVAAPWFLRSWAWTGNPVYPYLNSVFHGRDFSAEASERQLSLQYYKTIGDRSLDRLLLAPFVLTVTPDAFRSGYLGPIYLAALPFLWLVPLSRGARLLLLIGLVALPTWYFLYPRLRTLLPVIGAVSGAAAAGLIGLIRLHPITRALAVGSFSAWLLTSLAANGRYHLAAVPVALGLESHDSFLRRRLPQPDSQFLWYQDFMAINQLLPREASVLLWDTRGYYLDRPYIWANSVAQGLVPPEQQQQPAELVRALQARGITHVAMFPGEAPASSDLQIERLQYTLQTSGQLRPIYQSETMVLSEIAP
jgi:hypothetical protein